MPEEPEHDHADPREQEEGPHPQRGQERRDVQREQPVDEPAEEHRDPDRQTADLEREDLREPHPDGDVEEGLHRQHERGDQDEDHVRADRGPLRDDERGDTDEAVAGRGQEQPDEERLAAVQPVHVVERDDAADDGRETEEGVGERGRRLAEARFLQHPRAVVHDRVDAGELLRHADADPDEDDAPQPPVREDGPEAQVIGALLLLLADGLHLTELREGPVLGAHRLQHGEGVLIAALLDEPAGRLGHPHHAEEQGDRRERAHPEHDAPQTVDMPERGEEDVVDHEGRELAHDDRQLVAARDRPADLERRQLRQEHRHHRRSAADREPENDPADHQDPEAGREDGDQHAHEEHDREHDDRGAASDRVGDLSADEGSDGGGEDQRADDDAHLQVGEPELGLHRTFRAVGHPGVVTEQQATETRDDRDEADPFAIRAGNQWWKRGFTHAR